MNDRRQTSLACVLLTVLVMAVFYPVTGHDFLNMDDPFFIEQHHVPDGLTPANIKQAFTLHYGMWMPLTWLSHMTDSQLFGRHPAGHHLTSLAIHIANVLLLFLVLRAMTGTFYKALIVAGLFGLHPLNVEPVAYIACRKGLLAAFFWLSTLLVYTAYSRKPAMKRYLAVCLCFVLGMMAKPILVTLPLVLLLLDYWPLGRFGKRKSGSLILEKLPLLAVSAVIGVVTLFTQQQADALSSLAALPLSDRAANALINYAVYLGHIFWPVGLAVFYPRPPDPAWWQPIAAGMLLLIITVNCLDRRRESPYLLIGWLWFLVALLPVIGFIPVGSHNLADRYAYLPAIGIFIMMVWTADEFIREWRIKPAFIGLGVVIFLLVLGFVSRRQLSFWQNNETVFRHALAVTSDNYAAHNNLARALLEKGDLTEARSHLEQALKIHPTFPQALNNMGVLLTAEQQTDRALVYFTRALRYRPDFVEAHFNMARELLARGAYTRALTHYRKALEIDPAYIHAADIHYGIGVILASRDKTKQAISHFQEALSFEPGHIEAADGLARLYKAENHYDRAVALYQQLLEERPDCSISIMYNLACLFALKNEPAAAEDWLKKCIAAGFSRVELLKADKELDNIREEPWFRSLTETP